MLPYLLTGLSLGFYAAITPGPFQAFLMSQALKNGWRKSIVIAFAPLISDGPIIFLVLLVLTQMPVWAIDALRIVGGLFILYLAWGAYASSRKPAEAITTAGAEESVMAGFWKGVLMNALNPNPYIFWSLAAGPIFLDGWREAPAYGLSFMLGFYGAMISGFAALIILFSGARQLGPKATQVLGLVSALALFSFGLYQIWEGVSRFVA